MVKVIWKQILADFTTTTMLQNYTTFNKVKNLLTF